MIFTKTPLVDILTLVFIACFFLYKHFTKTYQYWEKRGVVYLKPKFLIGNAWEIFTFRKPMGYWLKSLYDSSTDLPYFGIFVMDEPCLIVKSPEVIKQMLVKDFNYFSDRTMAAPRHSDLYSNFMFAQKNPAWKSSRSKLSSAFTSVKIKNMFPALNDVGKNLHQYLKKHLGNLDAKSITTKYSIDAISKIFFEINAHCLDTENATLEKIGAEMFAFTFRNGFIQTCYFFKTRLVNLFQLNFFEKKVSDYFLDAFWKTVNSRKDDEFKFNNFVDHLRQVRKNDPTFDGDKMAAQGFQFFAAGFETTASTIAYTLYELCLNTEIQRKVREEISRILIKQKALTYEGVNEMKYLEMCIMETLRKYPVLPFLDRRCNADYKIPGSNLVIEKGIPVYIPVFGLHYDENHFPEPEKYIPERFLENVNSDKLIHFPFGYGPRMCIGERLGLLATKLGLIHVILNFEVERIPATPVPIEWEPKCFLLQSKVGLPMKFKKVFQTPA